MAEYQGWDTPYSLEQAANFIAEMRLAAPGAPGQWYQIAVALKPTSADEYTQSESAGPAEPSGPLIGDVAFCPTPDLRQATIGFTLARPYQGYGYAQEAVRRLLAHLFDDMQLHRVVAIADVLNTASIRLIERLGFRREAHFIESEWFKGRWSSEVWFGMLRREWQGRERPEQ